MKAIRTIALSLIGIAVKIVEDKFLKCQFVGEDNDSLEQWIATSATHRVKMYQKLRGLLETCRMNPSPDEDIIIGAFEALCEEGYKSQEALGEGLMRVVPKSPLVQQYVRATEGEIDMLRMMVSTLKESAKAMSKEDSAQEDEQDKRARSSREYRESMSDIQRQLDDTADRYIGLAKDGCYDDDALERFIQECQQDFQIMEDTLEVVVCNHMATMPFKACRDITHDITHDMQVFRKDKALERIAKHYRDDDDEMRRAYLWAIVEVSQALSEQYSRK